LSLLECHYWSDALS